MKRPVLVTGAAGFAGSHLLERLARELPPDRPLEAWHRAGGTRPPTGLDSRITWRAVDLLDSSTVDERVGAVQPHLIYHCAGSPHVASSWSDTLLPLQANVLSTHHLLRAVERHCRDARVFVPSSAMVYQPHDTALNERSPLGPRTPYGVSKLAQEMLAQRAERDWGLPVLIARPFNHIGPRQDASFVASAFAKQIAEAEAGLGEPSIAVGNLDARRDLTDVRDTVGAYVAIGERASPGAVYNVCSGHAYRIGDLLERLLSLAQVRVAVRTDPERLRPSDTPLLVGDPGRIRTDLGWQAKIPIEQTLADLLAHWRTRVGGTTRV